MQKFLQWIRNDKNTKVGKTLEFYKIEKKFIK